jgi:heme-degrading monooxygenase HmoA
MIVVANRIYVAKGKEAEFEGRFSNRAHLVDQSPGFIRNEVLRPTKDGDPYVVMTHWRDRESFDAWVHSDSFREAHKNTPPSDMFSRDNLFEMHEVVQSTDARG